jgi:hypothetical protein
MWISQKPSTCLQCRLKGNALAGAATTMFVLNDSDMFLFRLGNSHTMISAILMALGLLLVNPLVGARTHTAAASPMEHFITT